MPTRHETQNISPENHGDLAGPRVVNGKVLLTWEDEGVEDLIAA